MLGITLMLCILVTLLKQCGALHAVHAIANIATHTYRNCEVLCEYATLCGAYEWDEVQKICLLKTGDWRADSSVIQTVSNACARKPCAEDQICLPVERSTKYVCLRSHLRMYKTTVSLTIKTYAAPTTTTTIITSTTTTSTTTNTNSVTTTTATTTTSTTTPSASTSTITTPTTTTATTSTTTTTTTTTSTSTAAIISGTATSITAAAATTTTTSTSTTATTTTTYTTTSSTNTTSTTTKAYVAYAYVGCYVDNTARVLSEHLYQMTMPTVYTCYRHCLQERFAYFGVEYGHECYCANEMKRDEVYSKQPDVECAKISCTGDGSKLCGGEWRIAVYRIT